MAGLFKKKDFIPKSDELVLEHFFKNVITPWYREKIVGAVQYTDAQKEIDLLKSVKNGESVKKKKKDKKGRDNYKVVVEDTLVIEKLLKENAELKSIIQHMNTQKGTHSVESDSRFQTILWRNRELQNEIERLGKYINELKEKKARLKADAGLDIEEKDKCIKKLQELLQNSRSDVETLKMRLSKFAGDKLRDGNPDIADLSDPNRPTQLGTQFSEIYDNEWSDAYEALPKTMPEDKKVGLLHGLVQNAFRFCEDTFEEQTKAIKNILLAKSDDDEFEEDNGGGNDLKESQQSTGQEMKRTLRTTSILSNLKTLRKSLSHQTASNIAKKYAECNEILQFVSGFNINPKDIDNKVKQYARRCAELCWFMVVCDPPMCLSEDKEGQPFITDVYRPYTRSAKDIKDPLVHFHVWPALRLHVNGPLVGKGVAQPGESKIKMQK